MNKTNSFIFILSLILVSNSLAQRIDFLNKGRDIIYDLDILNNKLLVALSKNNVNYWDLNTKEIIKSYPSKNANLTCLNLSTDGKLLVIGDVNGSIKIIKFSSDNIVASLVHQGQGAITDIEFNKSDSQITASFQSGLIILVDINLNNVWEIHGHENDVMTIDFSEDEKFLASGDIDGIVKIWDIDKQKEVTSFKAHKSLVKDLFWCESDSAIISVGYDGKIVICKDFINATNSLHLTKLNSAGKISSVAYIPETKSIITCNLSGIVRFHFQYGVYKYKSSYAMHSIKVIPFEDNYSHIAVGTNGKGIMLIDSREMKLKNY